MCLENNCPTCWTQSVYMLYKNIMSHMKTKLTFEETAEKCELEFCLYIIVIKHYLFLPFSILTESLFAQSNGIV